MTFRLPQGSLATYDPDQGVWHPEWLGVDDDRDLLPYRTLIRQVQALAWSPTRAMLEETAAGVGARFVRWSRPARTAPATLPPALPRPPRADHGSLTGYLRRTPEARQAIRVALTQPFPRPPEAPLVCPPLGANPGLVGTAFDYALRFLVQGLNPHLPPGRGMLVARLAALDMDRERVLADVNPAEGTLREVADGLPFAERHARAAVVLASYKVVARTGFFQDLAVVVPPAAWQDVLAMIQAVPAHAFQAEAQLILNPRFPAAGRVNGADADLLLDDLLVEVKATRHLRLDGVYLQQLTGYLVLERLAGIQGSDRPIRRLGVYYARHGVLQVLPVRELFRPGFLPQLVSWFDESLPGAEDQPAPDCLITPSRLAWGRCSPEVPHETCLAPGARRSAGGLLPDAHRQR